jgi:hypothetical protein
MEALLGVLILPVSGLEAVDDEAKKADEPIPDRGRGLPRPIAP